MNHDQGTHYFSRFQQVSKTVQKYYFLRGWPLSILSEYSTHSPESLGGDGWGRQGGAAKVGPPRPLGGGRMSKSAHLVEVLTTEITAFYWGYLQQIR